MSGVVFLPPRPEQRHTRSTLSRARAGWRRGRAWWRRLTGAERDAWLPGGGRIHPIGDAGGRPGPGELGLRSRSTGAQHIIELSGALDLRTRDPLVEALAEALEDEDGVIVLDLSDLEALDHAGLGVLLTAHQRASDELKLMLIVPGRPAVQRVLDAARGPFLYASARGTRAGRLTRPRRRRTGVPSPSARPGAGSDSVRRSG